MTGRPSNRAPLLAVILRSALRAAPGVTLDSAAAALGEADVSPCSRSALQRMAGGDAPLTVEVLEVVLGHCGLPALAVGVARCAGGVYTPPPDAVAPTPVDRRLLALHGQLGQLSGITCAALEDGTLDDDEREAIALGAEALIEQLTGLAAQARGAR